MVGYLIMDENGCYVTKGRESSSKSIYFQACDPLEGTYHWVHSAGYEPMPAKDITSETKQGTPATYKQCVWASSSEPQRFQQLDSIAPIRVVSEAELLAARAEASDLMQRLTESQQEVAKATKDSEHWREKSHQLASCQSSREMAIELAEVKAERDRLAGQVVNLQGRLAKEQRDNVAILEDMLQLKRQRMNAA